MIGLDDKFSASFNLNKGGTKNVNIVEIKIFANDAKSDKINKKKTAIERYLRYIYPNKQFLDSRSITEKITVRKGKDKGKEETTNSYTIKKIFNDFVHAVFEAFEPRPEDEKLDIATGGEDMPDLETEEEAEKMSP